MFSFNCAKLVAPISSMRRTTVSSTPCERKLSRCHAVDTRQRSVAFGCCLYCRTQGARTPTRRENHQSPRGFWGIQILGSELAKCERAVCQQTDILTKAHLIQAVLEIAIHQIVSILNGDDLRQSFQFGLLDEFGDAPRTLIGYADMADLACLDQIGQCRESVSMAVCVRSLPGLKDN